MTYESATTFADKVLREHGSLTQLKIALDEKWLFPAAEAFANMGCTVQVDVQKKVLTVSREKAKAA